MAAIDNVKKRLQVQQDFNNVISMVAWAHQEMEDTLQACLVKRQEMRNKMAADPEYLAIYEDDADIQETAVKGIEAQEEFTAFIENFGTKYAELITAYKA